MIVDAGFVIVEAGSWVVFVSVLVVSSVIVDAGFVIVEAGSWVVFVSVVVLYTVSALVMVDTDVGVHDFGQLAQFDGAGWYPPST